jgi:hypothetical protein
MIAVRATPARDYLVVFNLQLRRLHRRPKFGHFRCPTAAILCLKLADAAAPPELTKLANLHGYASADVARARVGVLRLLRFARFRTALLAQK